LSTRIDDPIVVAAAGRLNVTNVFPAAPDPNGGLPTTGLGAGGLVILAVGLVMFGIGAQRPRWRRTRSLN
jgi:hypothetical protein